MSSTLSPSIIAVTGVSGFIGHHLAAHLNQLGHHVIGIDVKLPFAPLAGVDYRIADVGNRTQLEATLNGVELDFGVHLAAVVEDWGPEDHFRHVNVRGTQNTLDTFLGCGAKSVVHTSSIVTVGHHGGHMVSSNAPPRQAGYHYADTKVEAELYARELQGRGAPVVVLRPGDVYGVGSRPWVERPVALLRKRHFVLIDEGQGHFAHLHVRNFVQAILLAMASPQALGGTYIITDRRQDTTFREYFMRLAEAIRSPKPFLSLSRNTAMTLGFLVEAAASLGGFHPPYTRTAVDLLTRSATYDISDAVRDLGYHPRVSFEDGVRELAAHYRGLL